MTTKKKRKKLNLYLDGETVETLDRLESALDAPTKAEVIRYAISLLHWAHVQMCNNLTVGSWNDGVPAREIIIPFKKPPSNDPSISEQQSATNPLTH